MKTKILMIGGLSFLIGLFLVSQFGVTEGQNLYVSAKAVGEYRTTIESEKGEIANISDRIRDAEEQLVKYEEMRREDDFEQISKELASEVMKYKMFSGYETVTGSGIKVTVDDATRPLFEGENINYLLVHDVDIMVIINDLKRCGAEAISVNGQRIIDTTEISCSGYTVRINDQVSARPFVIRAIGDGKRMSATLLSPEGYGTQLKAWGVQFGVELLDDVFIAGHTGAPNYRYMTDVKEV